MFLPLKEKFVRKKKMSSGRKKYTLVENSCLKQRKGAQVEKVKLSFKLVVHEV